MLTVFRRARQAVDTCTKRDTKTGTTFYSTSSRLRGGLVICSRSGKFRDCCQEKGWARSGGNMMFPNLCDRGAPNGEFFCNCLEWDQIAKWTTVIPWRTLYALHVKIFVRSYRGQNSANCASLFLPGLPAEVWRQLLLLEWRMGLDTSWKSPGPYCFTVLFKMLVSIRMYGRAPVVWQRSFATELDKRNGKAGPAGLRLINNLDVLWKRGKHLHYQDYASGYLRNKSRTDSMLQQEVLLHRLRQHQILITCPFTL